MPTIYYPYTPAADSHQVKVSNSAYLDTLPSAQEFAALASRSSQIVTHTARRQEMFIRMNRVSLFEQGRSLEELPDVLRIADDRRPSQSRPDHLSAQMRRRGGSRQGYPSSSGLFLTPPSTPTTLSAPTMTIGRPGTATTPKTDPSHPPPLPPQNYAYKPYRRRPRQPSSTRTESFDHLFMFAEPLNISILGRELEEATEQAKPHRSRYARARRFSWEVDTPSDRDVK